MAGEQDSARLEALRRSVDELELEIMALRSKQLSRKEDLDIASDSLVNNLQSLKSVEARLVGERARLRERGDGDLGRPAAQRSESLTLESLLALARRPWERSEQALRDASNKPGFEKALLAELSRLVAGMHDLESRLEDPFSRERREMNGRAEHKPSHRQREERKAALAIALDAVDVVWDDADRAIVSAKVNDSQTFGGLLEYVAGYWGLDAARFSLFDSAGVCWPLRANVKETLAAAGERVVYFRRNERLQGAGLSDGLLLDSTAASGGAGGGAGGGTGGGTGLTSECDAPSDATRMVRFADETEADAEARTRLEVGLSLMELEGSFKRGYRFSLVILRYHCEAFIFLLMLTLVLNFGFFAGGSYDAQPMIAALEGAFVETPFPVCGSNCSSADAAPTALHVVHSPAGMYSFLRGPVRALLTDAAGATGGVVSDLPVVQEYNVLVGSVLLQQLRVQDACDGAVAGPLASSATSCFPSFARGQASEAPIEPGASQATVSPQAFQFQAVAPGAEANKDAWPAAVSGQISGVGDRFPLDKGGFYVELSQNAGVFDAQVQELVDANWIDDQTRAVVLTANFYNANLDLFVVAIVSFQFTSSMGVVARHVFVPTQLVHSFAPSERVEEYLLVVAGVLYAILLVLFFVDLARASSYASFLLRPQAIVDVALMAASASFAGLTLARAAATQSVEAAVSASFQNDDPAQPFTDLRGVAFASTSLRSLFAAISILLVLKGFAYLRLNPAVSFIGLSLSRALFMVYNFLFVFVAFLSAFALGAHYTLGRDEFVFHSYDLSLFSTAQVMLGIFDFRHLSPLTLLRFWPVLFVVVVYLVGFLGLYRVFFGITAFSYSKDMDRVRRQGYFWLPAINQEYRISPPAEVPAIRKLQVARRFDHERS